jgi:MFS transporter, CP family, cyanate transporter
MKEKPPGERTSSGHIDGPAPHEMPYRWVMLALLWVLYAAFGLIQRSMAPLVTPILRDLSLSYTQMGFILGSWQLTYIAAAFLAGTIIDRWGVRKSLFAGAMTLGLSSSLRYWANGFGALLGSVALSGMGGPMISVGAPKAISIWFQGKSRGTAIGVYLTGAWIGGIVSLSLTNSLIMPIVGQSWRHAFLLYGLLTFTGCGIWWFFARDAESSAEINPGISRVFGRLIRIRNVQVSLALGLLTFAVLHALSNWLPKILEGGGLSPATAGAAASLPLVSGIPALLIVPRLVPSRSRGRFLAISALLTLVALIVVMTVSGGIQIAALLVFGAIISPFVPILTLILMDTPEVGSTYMGAAGGLFYCVSEIGGFTGPLIMGAVVDWTGSFLAGTFLFAALCLGLFALTFLLKTE